MGYISKYNTKFLTFMNREYKKYEVNFEYFDDYAMWLYYKYCKSNEIKYYQQLEKDLWKYIDFQSGRERDKRDKLNSR